MFEEERAELDEIDEIELEPRLCACAQIILYCQLQGLSVDNQGSSRLSLRSMISLRFVFFRRSKASGSRVNRRNESSSFDAISNGRVGDRVSSRDGREVKRKHVGLVCEEFS